MILAVVLAVTTRLDFDLGVCQRAFIVDLFAIRLFDQWLIILSISRSTDPTDGLFLTRV